MLFFVSFDQLEHANQRNGGMKHHHEAQGLSLGGRRPTGRYGRNRGTRVSDFPGAGKHTQQAIIEYLNTHPAENKPAPHTASPSDDPGVKSSTPIANGCWLFVTAPYKAASTIFSDARSECPSSVPEIYVEANMYRSRRYGWEWLDGDSERQYWQSVVTVDMASYCGGQGIYDYAVWAYGESHSDQVYTASDNTQTNGINC
ncbi:hypothetical protein ACBJ59_35990 [Nonomuraea sp. MTCD27]|uniref:hypothetical protein n=1 Tax=Nonomuraea sp. MTCD27 TaxID=1676747 RepID=UPI0035C093EF